MWRGLDVETFTACIFQAGSISLCRHLETKVVATPLESLQWTQLYQLTRTVESETHKTRAAIRNVFSSLDLHIYWGTFYGSYRKSSARLMDQRVARCIFILSHPFLRAKGRGCVFFRHRRFTFGDALCIKILDRKPSHSTESGRMCRWKNIKIKLKIRFYEGWYDAMIELWMLDGICNSRWNRYTPVTSFSNLQSKKNLHICYKARW